MFVFGDDKRVDVRDSLFGTVVSSYDIKERNQIACIVFVSPEHPLYLVPTRFFMPSPFSMEGLSNSQKRKRCINFETMEAVQFGADDRQVEWITKGMAADSKLEMVEGRCVLKTVCVVSNESPKRLWSDKLGLVDVASRILNEVHPNLAYVTYFHFETDWDEMPPDEMKLANFKPSFKFVFQEFAAVELEYPELVKQAPWNKAKEALPCYVEDVNSGDLQEISAKKKQTDKVLSRIACLALPSEKQQFFKFFAPDAPRVVLTPFANGRIAKKFVKENSVLEATLFYSELNGFYVVTSFILASDQKDARIHEMYAANNYNMVPLGVALT